MGQEDPLEEEMATRSLILAWIIPWTEEPDRLQSMGSQSVRHDWAHAHTLNTIQKKLVPGEIKDLNVKRKPIKPLEDKMVRYLYALIVCVYVLSR